jgi:hypothetical protein
VKLRASRYYQNMIQIVGSSAEVILFLGGFFMGQKLFIIAFGLLGLRVLSKIAISEFMYKRMAAQIKEGKKGGS